MPDVFQLQASVKIDTSEANQKLDDLIAKAKELDGYLGGDHTVNPPKDGGGGSRDNGGGGKDNGGGDSSTGDKGPSLPPPPGSDDLPSNDATDTPNNPSKVKKVIDTIKEIGKMGLAAGTAFALTGGLSAGLSALLYDENNDINKSTRVQNASYNYEEYEALREWISLSNKLADGGFDMSEDKINFIETRRGAIMSQYNNGQSDLFNRYFDYLNAHNLDSMAGDILPQLNELDIEIPVEPKVEDGAAEEIAGQIGDVVIPATVQVTGVSGGGFIDTVKDVGANVLGDAAGAVAEGLLGSLLGKRKKSVGMDRIPTDNYVVALHQDESVLTKEEAAQWRKRTGNQESSSFDIANALRGVNVYLGADQVGHLISGPVGANINSRQNYKLRSMGG